MMVNDEYGGGIEDKEVDLEDVLHDAHAQVWADDDDAVRANTEEGAREWDGGKPWAWTAGLTKPDKHMANLMRLLMVSGLRNCVGSLERVQDAT